MVHNTPADLVYISTVTTTTNIYFLVISTAATTTTTVDVCVRVKSIAATTATTTDSYSNNWVWPSGTHWYIHTYMHTPIHNVVVGVVGTIVTRYLKYMARLTQ